jgi:hypothetical protein
MSSLHLKWNPIQRSGWAKIFFSLAKWTKKIEKRANKIRDENEKWGVYSAERSGGAASAAPLTPAASIAMQDMQQHSGRAGSHDASGNSPKEISDAEAEKQTLLADISALPCSDIRRLIIVTESKVHYLKNQGSQAIRRQALVEAISAMRKQLASRLAMEQPLSPGWSQLVDEHGNVYYEERVTSTTTWTRPTLPPRPWQLRFLEISTDIVFYDGEDKYFEMEQQNTCCTAIWHSLSSCCGLCGGNKADESSTKSFPGKHWAVTREDNPIYEESGNDYTQAVEIMTEFVGFVAGDLFKNSVRDLVKCFLSSQVFDQKRVLNQHMFYTCIRDILWQM